jgi:hypothetical protein
VNNNVSIENNIVLDNFDRWHSINLDNTKSEASLKSFEKSKNVDAQKILAQCLKNHNVLTI